MDELQDRDVCFGKVLNLPEVFQDPQVSSRGMANKYNHPYKGNINLLGSGIKLSDVPFEIRIPPASFGEHTEQILRELGYRETEIEGFKEQCVV